MNDFYEMKMHRRVRTLFLALSGPLLVAILCSNAHGAAGDVDLSFDPGSGIDRQVNVVTVQPDGKVIIGGEFLTVKGLLRPHLARLNADGSGDATFNAGAVPDSYVSAIAVQPDGKVLCARDFYNLYRQPIGSDVRRLNSDGTLDASFASDTGDFPDGHGVTCMVLQPDGKVVAGGYYNDYYVDEGGILNFFARPLLVRLNADGSADPTFAKENGIEGSMIKALALQPDGKIIISGGIAAEVNGDYRFHVLRLNVNGTVDTDFDPGTDGNIWFLSLRPDGKIIVGGGSIWNGTDRRALALLNTDGSLNAQFNPATDPLSGINALVELPDGKVLIGGPYIKINGVHQNGLARLNADGSVDGGFNPGAGPGAPGNGGVAIALQTDGKMFVAGAFATFNGASRGRIARLNADGSVDSNFDPGASISGGVDSIVMLPDGKALIRGSFTSVGGAKRNRIARLHSNGNLDPGFDPGTGVSGESFSLEISAIAAQADGRVMIGGDFSLVDGNDRFRLARLEANGTVDTSFVSGIGGSAFDARPIQSIAILQDGRMLIAEPGGVDGLNAPKKIALLNSGGSVDQTFNPAIPAQAGFSDAGATSLVVQPDGKVIVAGLSFSDWYYAGFLLRFNADGSLDAGFARTDAGGDDSLVYDATIHAVALQPDGKVLLGGNFSNLVIGGNPAASRKGIARLNADGTLDTSFNSSSGISGPWDPTVKCIAVQPDGQILIGGSFTGFNGIGRNGVARLNADGSLDGSFNPGAGANAEVRAIALQPDGSVLIGGIFKSVNGIVRPGIARLYGSTQPPTSFAAWATSFGLAGAAAAADADPDRDGLPNGVEYVLGENPLTSRTTVPPSSASARPSVAVTGGNMLFTFLRDDASETPDVSVKVENGMNLIAWPNVFVIGANTAGSSPGVTVSENGTAPDTITVAIPIGTTKAMFARLKVAVAP
jgi:uncharacterized delta-60 repeat protein